MTYIEISGKKLPVHFGLKAISKFAQNTKKEFSSVIDAENSLSSVESIVPIAVMGLNDGSRRNGGDPNCYSEDDVWDMIDEDISFIVKVSEIFVESVTPMTEKLGIEIKNETSPTAPRKKK